MSIQYDIEVRVISQKGKCGFGHKVGDIIYFDGKTINGAICYSALMALLPYVFGMRYGVKFPWNKDENINIVACQDASKPVVFEVKRIKKSEG